MIRCAWIAVLCLASCAYSASSLVVGSLASGFDAEQAVRVAEQTARRFRMRSLGGFDEELPGGSRLLAKFTQPLYSLEEYYPVDGSMANIRFSVYSDADGALRFAVLDYSHGRETEYVRLIRSDLEARLREAFPEIELRFKQHSGRTLPP